MANACRWLKGRCLLFEQVGDTVAHLQAALGQAQRHRALVVFRAGLDQVAALLKFLDVVGQARAGKGTTGPQDGRRGFIVANLVDQQGLDAGQRPFATALEVVLDDVVQTTVRLL